MTSLLNTLSLGDTILASTSYGINIQGIVRYIGTTQFGDPQLQRQQQWIGLELASQHMNIVN